MTSTAASTDVLLVGATGTLGSRIAHHLLTDGAALRVLARPGAHDPRKTAALDELVHRGATVVEGDLADLDSLAKATIGIDEFVSAVQGGPGAIIDGQVALAADHVSFQQTTDTVERLTGRTYERRSLGTAADLRARIEQARHADPTSMTWIPLTYLLFMVTDQTSLEDLQNERYPDLHPETFDSVARRLLAAAATRGPQTSTEQEPS